VAKKRISDDPAGFTALTEMLAAAGDSSEDLIPIAIETPRGLLVAALRATGRPVFAINTMAVARYRERHSVAGAKSDHADAMTLANILRVDGHLHRKLPADSELAQAITVLARAQQDAVWRRSKASNELRSIRRPRLPEVQHLAAPRGADVRVDVVGDRVLLVDDQAGAVGQPIRRPLRFPRRADGPGLRGEIQPAGPHPR
jgi:Transposase